MLGKTILVLVCIGGIIFFLLKLIKTIFSEKSKVLEVIDVICKKGFERVMGKNLEKGRRIVSQGESILNGLESFLDSSEIKMPQYKGKDSQELIADTKRIVEHVKEFMNNPSSLASETVLKFLLSTITSGSTDDPNYPLNRIQIIEETADKIVKGKNTEEEKARAIYDWIEQSITYGSSKRGRRWYRVSPNHFTTDRWYRTPAEVFSDKEGVCGEMAVLNVVMNRSVGLLKSYFVMVDIDNRGNRVGHACASVLINGRTVLEDPAYHVFDIKHRKYEIRSDKETVEDFKRMRGA